MEVEGQPSMTGSRTAEEERGEEGERSPMTMGGTKGLADAVVDVSDEADVLRLPTPLTPASPASSALAIASTLNVLPVRSFPAANPSPTLLSASSLAPPIPLDHPVPIVSFPSPLPFLRVVRRSPSATESSFNPSHQLPRRLRSTSRRVVGSQGR